MARTLSDREEKFAQAFILQGGGKVKAYKAAGYSMNMSQASISTQAERVFKKPHVAHRIKELQGAANTVVVMTKDAKLLVLEDVINACVAPDPDKGVINAAAVTAAIKEHNLMQGDNAPTQTESTLKVETTLAERLTGASKR